MKKIFRCDCTTHLLEIDYDKKFSLLSIIIYDIYSPKTGRKYKRPKLQKDVVLMNNYYPKELDKFIEFIDAIKENRKCRVNAKKLK